MSGMGIGSPGDAESSIVDRQRSESTVSKVRRVRTAPGTGAVLGHEPTFGASCVSHLGQAWCCPDRTRNVTVQTLGCQRRRHDGFCGPRHAPRLLVVIVADALALDTALHSWTDDVATVAAPSELVSV
jgi:hypothetical protein